jgi:hypothetical protein
MAIRIREVLRGWFSTGKYPTQTQFSDFFDSFFHKSEDEIGMDKITGLQAALNSKQPVTGQTNPNEAQVIYAPGFATLITAQADTFGLAVITLSIECGELRLPLTLYVPNTGTWIKEVYVMEIQELEDFEINQGVVDNRVNIIITYNSAPGEITIKKPTIQYY